MKMMLLLSLLVSGHSFAKTNLTKVEVYPPHLSVGCANGPFDRVGSLGLELTKVSADVFNERFSVTFTHQLKLCTDLGANDASKMGWIKVDPFKGFEVPFYNARTNKSDVHHQAILSSNKTNLFENYILSEDGVKLLYSSPLISKNGGYLQGFLSFYNNDLLDQNDLDLLDQGKTVTKRFEYDLVSVMTASFSDNMTKSFDTVNNWSSRYINFTFEKKNDQIKLRSLSL